MIGKLGKEVKALKKILIVEDDQLLNRTLAYNLTSDGYEAQTGEVSGPAL